MLRNNLGLRFGTTKAYEERIFKNGWPTTVFGRALCLADLGVPEFASISRHAEPYGAVVLLNEEQAGRLQLGTLASFDREATHKQRQTLEKVASVNGDSIPNRLLQKVHEHLPALALGDVAISENEILFRDGRLRNRFESVMGYLQEEIPALEDEAFRDYNMTIRLHLIDKGCDLSEVPQAKLDDERRETMRHDVFNEMNELYAHAQLLQRIDVSTPQFIIASARQALQATLY